MRKSTVLSILALLLLSAGAFVMLKNPFSPSRGLVESMTEAFMEDLQFKDFRGALLQHHLLDRDRMDIGKALEALFKIKPELLDIKDFDVVRVDFDKGGESAKALVRTRYKILNHDDKLQEKELVLYWKHRHPDCPQGGTCPAGQCVNEVGEAMYKPREDDKKKDKKDPLEASTDGREASGEVYACDASKEFGWFMNLDSSIKQKNYEDSKNR